MTFHLLDRLYYSLILRSSPHHCCCVRFASVWSKNRKSPRYDIFGHVYIFFLSECVAGCPVVVFIINLYICDTFLQYYKPQMRRFLLLTHNIISCICIIYSVQALCSRLLTQSAIRNIKNNN